MKKKGSLNMSIEVIIVIVIAFVVLGLGLSFVRSQFKTMSETTSSVQEQIKQQILDDLRTGDKKLSFPASEVTISKKESSVTAIGIKNVKAGKLNYKLKIEQTFGGDQIFGDSLTNNFLYATEIDELQPTETRVIPVRITSETIPGTGQFKLTILDIAADGTETPYDSKTFFITVTG